MNFGKLRVMSDLLTRSGLNSLLGLSFGGKRDIYKVFGWKKNLTYTDYVLKYTRHGIAKRVVEAPASATWRNPPTLSVTNTDTAPPNPDKSNVPVNLVSTQAFIAAWNKVAEEFDIWSNIERADRLAGLGNYSILLLGYASGGAMDTPVTPRVGNELLYVQPYSQQQAWIKTLDADPTSPRFGLPTLYTIKLGQGIQSQNQVAFGIGQLQQQVSVPDFDVHYTRVVHIAENLTTSNFLGTPRLEAVYNDLDDLEKVSGGSAEAFWLGANKGMQLDVDKDMDLDPADAAALDDEITEYQHELRRVIRTKGVKVNPLNGNVPDPKNTFGMILSKISGATGIPQRVLIGSEAGQLASDQDRANWSDRITERRKHFAEPCILNPLIESLANAGVLPEVEETDYAYIWPPNFQLTPLEAAQTMAQKARAAINLGKMFVDGQPVMNQVEARDILGLPAEPVTGGPVPKPILLPSPPAVPGAVSKGPKGSPSKDATDHQPNDFSAKN